ncbi:MAG: hypothetical protein QME06_07540, partial [Desulfobacterales bacterium]|nr:hypothetical protein [Desulfobacterales bacterium]
KNGSIKIRHRIFDPEHLGMSHFTACIIRYGRSWRTIFMTILFGIVGGRCEWLVVGRGWKAAPTGIPDATKKRL